MDREREREREGGERGREREREGEREETLAVLFVYVRRLVCFLHVALSRVEFYSFAFFASLVASCLSNYAFICVCFPLSIRTFHIFFFL